MLRLAALLCVFAATAAVAMVGHAPPPPATLARHVVLISGSAGTFCTGAVVAPDAVLTAGHCVDARHRYKLIEFAADGTPQFRDVASAARHPQFDIKAFLNHRATADVAVLKLAAPLPARYAPALLAPGEKKVVVGERLTVAGYGVSLRGDGRTGGTLRAATLAVTSKPGTLQIRMVDPKTNNAAPGLGACTGDSGAPAFDSSGAIVGVVSWTTAPNNEDGCGGLTGITPLTLYRKWIVETVNTLRARL